MNLDHASNVARLRQARDNGGAVFVVHYACESLAVVRKGSPAVSAVGFLGVYNDQSYVFSVADRAEGGEEHVLRNAFEFMRDNSGSLFAHWRMGSSEFGFGALANRYHQVLNQQVRPPGSESLADIARLIALAYGEDFADHPQLVNLVDLNGLRRRHFLTGAEEAAHFKDADHAPIRRSLSEKLSHLASLVRRLVDGTIETKWHGRRLGFAGAHLDSVKVAQVLGTRLVDVARQLKRRHSKRPTLELNDEYDYQDLLHGLLRVFFDDVRAEAYSPDYAGGASRVDFRLPAFRLAIELKHPKSFKDKELGDQLIVDIERYQKIP
ncbi:MAG TPA: hypothetical protein PK156_50635, partial [Polyangium sp.]|nr:hypothetical protein [Polyangium sp.]